MKSNFELIFLIITLITLCFDGLLRTRSHAEAIKKWYKKINFDYFSIESLILVIRVICLFLIGCLCYFLWGHR